MKKVVALILTLVMTVSLVMAMGGCKKKVADDEQTLEIFATNAGYGIKWIEALIPIFEEQNPGVKVIFNYNVPIENTIDKVKAGPSVNTADLLFTIEKWPSVIMQGEKGVAGYDYALEDMTDFLNEKDENGVALRDKFLPYYLEAGAVEIETSEGEYEYRDFTLPWATSYTGIVYNKTLFEKNGWELPRTTDELLALTDEIKAADIIPLVNETSTGYIEYMSNCLFAQYIGVDEYYNYFNPITEEDYYNYSLNGSSKGRLYAMYVMDDLLNPSNGRLSKTAAEDDYGRAQGRLISGEGAMAIMGDWFDTEMSVTIEQANEKGKNYQSGMMSIPVISALSDQLSYWDVIMKGSESYQFARSGSAEGKNLPVCDELLAKLVDYVDDGMTGELPSVDFNGQKVTATQEDAEIVARARNTYYSLGAGHSAVIPSYAVAKDLAKDFLRLLYSDTGAEIFLENTSGSSLPIKYDVTSWDGYADTTDFQKDVYRLTSTGYAAMIEELFTWRISGLPTASKKGFQKYAKTDSNYVSPDTYFQKDSLTKEQFIEIMKNAGLL